MENIFVEFLPPWIETGLQPAFYDKESGTVLQQTARMYARVNMLIRMFNKLSKNTKTEIENFEESTTETVNEYIDKFNELHDYVHDYFDNLDVQEEINNKLDAMVEAGTLQEIITTYIQSNVAWTFDTVADMKAATNLVDGSFAQTLGFYTINDGGGAIYKITNSGTANEMDVIAIGSLYANLIVPSITVPEMLGAKGDGIHDDQTNINRALELSRNIEFMSGKTYCIRGYEAGQAEGPTAGLFETTGLVVNSGTTIDLNFATIKILTNSRKNYHGFTIKNVHDITLKNGTIIGDVSTHIGSDGEWGYGIALEHAENIHISNMLLTKCWGDGINLNNSTGTAGSDNKNIFIDKCICDDNRRQGMSIESVDTIMVTNSEFINTGKTSFTAPGSGVDVEPGNNYNLCENIVFKNCKFTGNYRTGMLFTGSTEINHITIMGCNITNNMQSNETLYDHGNLIFRIGQFVTIKNCTIGSDDKITYLFLRTQYSGTVDEMNTFLLENNLIFNTHLYIRPINCNNVKYSLQNNTFTLNKDLNSYLVQVEPNSGYTSNNLNVIVNLENNKFSCDSTKTLLSYFYCENPNSSGVNKVKISGNTFYYSERPIRVGTGSVIENNNFICNKNSVIAFIGGGTDNTTFVIKDNLIQYPNISNGAISLIEDWPQNYLAYAVRNVVLQDNALNMNDVPADSLTHANTMKMFVYNRTGSISESNNIYQIPA